MNDVPLFGSEDRYYAGRDADAGRFYNIAGSNLEKNLTETLLRRYPDLDKLVERTHRRWNLSLREILRSETGLRLSVGENRQAVSVRVVDELPPPFWNIYG